MTLNIRENISLRPYNTLGIQVNAKYFVELKTYDDFFEFMRKIMIKVPKFGAKDIEALAEIIKEEFTEEEYQIFVDYMEGHSGDITKQQLDKISLKDLIKEEILKTLFVNRKNMGKSYDIRN